MSIVSAPLDTEVRAFWLPKAGNSDEEYEDAWLVGPPDRQLRQVAIADGATETFFAAHWARQLVAGYCAGVLDAALLPEGLLAVQEEWQASIADLALPWYAEEKARQGAFAALLGLTLTNAPGPLVSGVAPAGVAVGGWEALALGDCCLFQVRHDHLVAAFPLATSAAFTNRPTLLSSVESANPTLADDLLLASGLWFPGDRFYLLSDALACWFLTAHETGALPWQALDEHHDEEAFAAWITGQRQDRALRNDDVTLLIVEV